MPVDIKVTTLGNNCTANEDMTWVVDNATITTGKYSHEGYFPFTVKHTQHCNGRLHPGHVRTITQSDVKGHNAFNPAHVSLLKIDGFDEKTNYFFEISSSNKIQAYTTKKKSKSHPGTSLSIDQLPKNIAKAIKNLLTKMYANTV